MITLRSLLALPKLEELSVVAGEAGLDHVIKAVATLDAPDGPQWLRGGEFILSSSYIFKDNLDGIEKFVRDLIAVGAAGLGIKSGRYLPSIPTGVAELANQNGFPIITIPQKLVWSDIIAPFYELTYKISSSQNLIKFESGVIDSIFAASRWGAQRMMEEMTALFEIPMVILLRNKKVLGDNALPGVEKIKFALNDERLYVENSENVILKLDDESMVIRAIPSRRVEKQEYIALLTKNTSFLEELNNMFRLLARLQGGEGALRNDREARYQRLLLDVVSDKATSEGLNDFAEEQELGDVHGRVAIITAKNWSETYELLREQLRAQLRGSGGEMRSYCFFDENRQEAVVLLELRGDVDKRLGVSIRAAAVASVQGMKEPGGHLALGRRFDGIEKLPESYRQARETKRIGPILWTNQKVYFYSSVAIYSEASRLGFLNLDLEDVHLLEESGKQFAFDGVATLEAYLESASYKKAAAKLYIHENTMRYRIQKICELLRLDTEDPQQNQSMIVKIKYWKLMKSGKRTTLPPKS